MAAAPGGPQGDRINEVLTGLLAGVLAPLRDSHPAVDIKTTAALLQTITDRIVAEVMLVPHDG